MLLTGASGFVGRSLLPLFPGASTVRLDVDDWRERIGAAPLAGATVIHLAARVHREGDADEMLYERDNVGKTAALAEAARAARARRFIFLSTIKVNGEETHDKPFGPDDPAAPMDAYARSKWRAETTLRDVAGKDLDFVIVRSPLVLGAGAHANLRALAALADSAWPLPFASIRNRRTLVHVDDLARLISACAREPDASGRVFLAGDPAPASTPFLLHAMRAALGRPARLFAMPRALLEAAAAGAGNLGRMRRLTRSLEADVSETARVLGWRAQVPLERALAEVALAHRREARA